MIKPNGKYNSAIVYTDNIESAAISQIITLLNQPFASQNKIRFMPDVHAGKGCTIGFTMKIDNMVCPNLVGVDIGCGVLVTELGNISVDFEELNNTIIENIPYGFDVKKHKESFPKIKELRMYDSLENEDRILKSLGTLGSGNHYIEIDKDDSDNKYLVIHSGSRNLGVQVCNHYQRIAKEKCKETSKDLEYIVGQDYDNYLHDMQITQHYAYTNRVIMADTICNKMGWKPKSMFQTVHNYIDNDGVVRKGAVSAKDGEKLIIPLNMRDGALLCIGKGNPEWNHSAPHGAGRILSRGMAKRELKIDDFTKEMSGIYSKCVDEARLDESPMAYKNYKEIIDNIGDTVKIIAHIKPIYNFKG